MKWLFLLIIFFSWSSAQSYDFTTASNIKINNEDVWYQLAEDVRIETQKAWNAYRTYAWGHDNLKPLTKSYSDWYDEPLFISLIDAYSTLYIMGFQEECSEIEEFIIHEASFKKDLNVKVFEVNIRILGGLLSMYELCPDSRILDKAIDFADRMLPAFDSPTGLPYYWINLKTGKVGGEVLNVAEAGSYLIEMGMLSYYTSNPIYYQNAKKASQLVYDRRSAKDMLGRALNIENGEWVNPSSSVGCYSDSYYEYLIKAYSLFSDIDLKNMWDTLFDSIKKYHLVRQESGMWFGKVNMNSGMQIGSDVTLWDAYFPGQLASIGELELAQKFLKSWDAVWSKYESIPMYYDYKYETTFNPYYQLNPELIESTYYLWHYTGDDIYLENLKRYYLNIKTHCSTDVAFANLKSVITKEQDDRMPSFLFAETMKYFYLAFSNDEIFDLDHTVYTTEAHPFMRSTIDHALVPRRLGI